MNAPPVNLYCDRCCEHKSISWLSCVGRNEQGSIVAGPKLQQGEECHLYMYLSNFGCWFDSCEGHGDTSPKYWIYICQLSSLVASRTSLELLPEEQTVTAFPQHYVVT